MLGAVRVTMNELDSFITSIGNKYGVDSALIKSIIKQESNWDVNASRYEVHKKDASWGLMQLMLATAREVLNNPNLTTSQLIQPDINIEAGTKLLARNIRRWGNIPDAVAAYNAGSPRIDPKTGKYVNAAYVDNVMRNYAVYRVKGIVASPVTTLLTVGLVGVGLFVMGSKK